MNCLMRAKGPSVKTRDVGVQTEISFVRIWSITDETGAYINASSETILNSECIRGGKGNAERRAVCGYSGIR